MGVQQVSFKDFAKVTARFYFVEVFENITFFMAATSLTPKEIEVLSYISFPTIITDCMFGYISNQEGRKSLYACMFIRMMEIVTLSKSQILQLVNAYLQLDGESRGNGIISNFRIRMIIVFSLAEGQKSD